MNMRTVAISTDVFAAIWANRLAGEDSEDAILRRLFNVAADNFRERTDSNLTKISESVDSPARSGTPIVDSTNGVRFEHGFKVYRFAKGVQYEAEVQDGQWLLKHDKKLYSSINQMSQALGLQENVWNHWYYIDGRGKQKKLNELRPRSLITKRRRRS
ncbi:MAG: hypothetical protein U1E20_15085 [Methylocystis sp.]|uniref:hypothetical protein n=1 Tax=Methylocystis sp. TaxID=1911079 RepID=UPI0039341D49